LTSGHYTELWNLNHAIKFGKIQCFVSPICAIAPIAGQAPAARWSFLITEVSLKQNESTKPEH